MSTFDAIVIGAGPAGSTAALRLARGGWSVALVEKTPFPRAKVCGEFISAYALSLLAGVGLEERVLRDMGPPVCEVAVYAGETTIAAPMPAGEDGIAYGRALGRDRLDSILIEAARSAGAHVLQPWRARGFDRAADAFAVRVEREAGSERSTLHAPVVIAAHGSWNAGGLALPGTRSRRDSDLLAFKTRFEGAALAPGRMPLLAFPGGYGGLVHTDSGQVSFSCCIRRDALAQCRADAPGSPAGAAVLAHALGACRGLREALAGATRSDAWLAAGPLRIGIRSTCGGGYFAAGNAMGEAHPIVAEGISMAIQSAWLLCDRLLAAPRPAGIDRWNAIARDYARAYRRNFEPRMRAAAAFATIAMRPRAAAAAAGMLALSPSLLALGARAAGKGRALRTSA